MYLYFKAIKNIKEIWSGINVHLETYKDKGIHYVKVNDDIFQLLEDHLMQLSMIKTSKYLLHRYNYILYTY